jgi:hypothetical protein
MSSDSSHYSPQTQLEDKSQYSPQSQPVPKLGVNTKPSSVKTAVPTGVQTYTHGVKTSVGEQSQVAPNFHKDDLRSPSSLSRKEQSSLSRTEVSEFKATKFDVKSYSGSTFTEVNVTDVKSRIRKLLNHDKPMKRQHSAKIKNWINMQ